MVSDLALGGFFEQPPVLSKWVSPPTSFNYQHYPRLVSTYLYVVGTGGKNKKSEGSLEEVQTGRSEDLIPHSQTRMGKTTGGLLITVVLCTVYSMTV